MVLKAALLVPYNLFKQWQYINHFYLGWTCQIKNCGASALEVTCAGRQAGRQAGMLCRSYSTLNVAFVCSTRTALCSEAIGREVSAPNPAGWVELATDHWFC